MSLLNHALKYLSEGYSVIPVGREKGNTIKWKEFQYRRPLIEEVTDWWTKYPEANIGIICGEVSNVTVIDMDPRHGCTEPPKIPITRVVNSGGGGWHYYYKYCPAIRSLQKVDGLPGVEIKNDGRYVIAPPSIHRSGGTYEVGVDETINEFPFNFFSNKVRTGSKKSLDDLLSGVVQNGERNDAAFRIACSLLKFFPQDQWLSVCLPSLQFWNKQWTEAPMSESEVKTTFESAINTVRPKI